MRYLTSASATEAPRRRARKRSSPRWIHGVRGGFRCCHHPPPLAVGRHVSVVSCLPTAFLSFCRRLRGADPSTLERRRGEANAVFDAIVVGLFAANTGADETGVIDSL